MINRGLKDQASLMLFYLQPLKPLQEEMRHAAEISIRVKTLPVTLLEEDEETPQDPPQGSMGGSSGGPSRGSSGAGGGTVEGSARGAAAEESGRGPGRGSAQGAAEGPGKGSDEGDVRKSAAPHALRLPSGERTCGSCGKSGACRNPTPNPTLRHSLSLAPQ